MERIQDSVMSNNRTPHTRKKICGRTISPINIEGLAMGKDEDVMEALKDAIPIEGEFTILDFGPEPDEWVLTGDFDHFTPNGVVMKNAKIRRKGIDEETRIQEKNQ